MSSNVTARLRAQRGFAIVEIMMGAVLLTLAGVEMGTVVIHMSSQNRKAQTQAHALALQSGIIEALGRTDTFAGSAQLAAMTANTQSGTAGNALILGLALKNTTGQVIAISGQRIGLDMNYAGCDPTDAECPFRVDFALQCSAAVGCSAAYRVTLSNQTTPVAAAAFGAPIRHLASAAAGGDN